VPPTATATATAAAPPRFSRRLRDAYGPAGADALPAFVLAVMGGYLPATADLATYRRLCCDAGLEPDDYDTWQDYLDMLLGLG
jgi:hypothetical protein